VNYLAHFHLASCAQRGDDDNGLIIGALLGDFIKGPLKNEWPGGWERGIAMHRRIDALTDSHPEVSALLTGLPGNYRRYGGIMFDVCFDYCLVQHWGNFHPEPLPDFAQQIYAALGQNDAEFPAAARKQAQRLARYNVLVNMGNWQTVENMLTRIGQRLKRDNPLASSAPVLQDQLVDIEAHFLRLYPQLLDLLTNDKIRA
jgi:acyl carrier protein phosphodiesterase